MFCELKLTCKIKIVCIPECYKTKALKFLHCRRLKSKAARTNNPIIQKKIKMRTGDWFFELMQPTKPMTRSGRETVRASIRKSKFKGKINSLVSGHSRGYSEKKRLNVRGCAWEFLLSGMFYRPGKSLKKRSKSFSLHSKKFFLLGGCGIFVSVVISGGLLGHLGHFA